jgi:adenylosuccinate synthase
LWKFADTAGLSLHHGIYPYVTGRCTTAAALCSEAGVGPTVVDRVYLVIRTYPIRVGGTSGPMKDEIDWETVTRESGYPTALLEKTTVTKKIRRVGRFDMDAVVRACELNGTTHLCLTFADYLDANDRDVRSFDALSRKTREFVDKLEDATDRPVCLISTGPETRSTIDRR